MRRTSPSRPAKPALVALGVDPCSGILEVVEHAVPEAETVRARAAVPGGDRGADEFYTPR